MIFIKSNFLVLIICLSVLAHSQCSTIGPLTAGSVSNNATIGTIGWGNLLNTQLSDNSYSSAGTTLGVLSSAYSNYIVFKNFGFTIPLGASICGIEVTREASASGLLIGSSIRDIPPITLQRSGPSMQWTTIDTVNGAGYSNEKKQYQLMDEPPNSINYYRLVQTDIDGHSSYSSVVTVSMEKQRDAISIYPNPVKQRLYIPYSDNLEDVQMLHLDGRLVQVIKNKVSKDRLELWLPKLQDGIYLLQLKSNNTVFYNRVVVKQ